MERSLEGEETESRQRMSWSSRRKESAEPVSVVVWQGLNRD